MADGSLLATSIGGVSMSSCIFNAVGPKDVTLDELKVIAKSKSSVISMKSCTLEAREGNPEPRYSSAGKHTSINSMGLPNLGYKEYVKYVDELKSEFSKPILASISGMTLEDNIEIFKAFNKTDVDIIEFNPGSPNTIGKPIVGYDYEEVDRQLAAIMNICDKPMGIKLPPYFDFIQFEKIASVLQKYKLAYIASINSIGNGLAIDADKEQTLIRPKDGFGGIGGAATKYTGLANIRKFYELLGDKVKLVGVGGVINGQDAFEYILAGASAVQVGTAFVEEGPGCFERIEKELAKYVAAKNYKNIEEFRGKLKTI